jgi:integrase
MAKESKEITEHKNLIKRNAVWYVKRMVDGKVIVQSTGETVLRKARIERDRILHPTYLRDERERAEAMLAKVEGIDRQLAKIEDDAPATTIMHGWQEYLDQHSRPDTGETTLEVYRLQFEAFAKWFRENHPAVDTEGNSISWELRQVTQDDADQYAGYLLKKISATTFNRHMNLLALMWRTLTKTSRLSANPWSSENIKRKKFVPHSRRELTIEEVIRVMSAAQGEMRLLLALGVYCGLRLGDAACLDWSSVDMVKGIISLVPLKTARRKQTRVTLPIHRTLYEMLAEIPSDRRQGLVMPALAGRYHSFDGALAKDVNRLFLSVDIKTGANSRTRSEKETASKEEPKALGNGKSKGKKARRATADCGFHSLRHTFVSLCAAGGVSQSIVQSLVGHGSPAMTQHYTHIGIETAQNAVALLPDVTGTEAPQTKTDATDAKLATVLTQLDGLTDEQLKVTAKKIREIVEKRKTAECLKVELK